MSDLLPSSTERRQHLAAAWRVILHDGLEHASVRNVAPRSRVVQRLVAPHFSTPAEPLDFAMNQVVERIERRLGALDPTGDPRDRGAVPPRAVALDAERQEENAVWLAFTARALVDPELRECAERDYDDALRAGCRRWVVEIAGDQVDVEREADRLHAVLDGLAVHAATRPEIATATRRRAILATHLDTFVPRRCDTNTLNERLRSSDQGLHNQSEPSIGGCC